MPNKKENKIDNTNNKDNENNNNLQHSIPYCVGVMRPTCGVWWDTRPLARLARLCRVSANSYDKQQVPGSLGPAHLPTAADRGNYCFPSRNLPGSSARYRLASRDFRAILFMYRPYCAPFGCCAKQPELAGADFRLSPRATAAIAKCNAIANAANPSWQYDRLQFRRHRYWPVCPDRP